MNFDRIFLKNFTLQEMENWVESIGERRFRARQLYRHVYARRVNSWDDCSDLSKSFRAQLEHGAYLNALNLIEEQESSDNTRKYIFKLHDGLIIESVLIPDPPRYTLCISSQAGCAMGCKFCLTGAGGLKRNLSTAEIIDQVCRIEQHLGSDTRLTNIVLMGMGEPLANYDAVLRALQIMTDPDGMAFSHRRITLSTAGLVPQLYRIGKESPVNIAVSLHAPNDELRNELMPINRKYPLKNLMAACRTYPLPPRKRITFEYVLLDRVNDDPKEARALVRLLQGIRAKLNLIPFNPHPGSCYRSPSPERVLAFQEVLHKAQLTAIIRRSRGTDIGAACGQLRAASQGTN